MCGKHPEPFQTFGSTESPFVPKVGDEVIVATGSTRKVIAIGQEPDGVDIIVYRQGGTASGKLVTCPLADVKPVPAFDATLGARGIASKLAADLVPQLDSLDAAAQEHLLMHAIQQVISDTAVAVESGVAKAADLTVRF